MNDFEIEDPFKRIIDRLCSQRLKNDYYMIGSVCKQEDRTCFTYEQTDNGFCFKDERAFVERSGVCYIPECEFEPGINCLCYIGNDIPMGFYTYDRFFDEVENYAYNVFGDDDELFQMSDELRLEFYDRCASDVFNMVDWQDPLSYLFADYDINEAFEQFLLEKTPNK